MMATAYKSLHSSSSCSERSEEWERIGTRGSGHRAPSSAAAGSTLGNDEIPIPFILFSFDLIFTKIYRTPNKIGYLIFPFSGQCHPEDRLLTAAKPSQGRCGGDERTWGATPACTGLGGGPESVSRRHCSASGPCPLSAAPRVTC